MSSLARATGPALAIALVAGSARAQSSAAGAAEALLDAGLAEMAAGDLASACPRFAESHRLRPSAAAFDALVDCNERAGRVVEAWTRVREAARQAHEEGAAGRAASLDAREARLRPRLAWLTIRVTSVGGDPVVTRDGETVPKTRWGLREPVDPGPHALTVTTYEEMTRAHVTWRHTVTLAAGESRAIELPWAEKTRTGPRQATAGWVLAGTGVALTTVGVLFGLAGRAKHAEARRLCTAQASDDCRVLAPPTESDGDTYDALGVVSIAAGAIGLGVGLTLIATAPPDPGPGATRPKGARLSFGGRF